MSIRISTVLASTIMLTALAISSANAHPGRTDADGCHNMQSGTYHCHSKKPSPASKPSHNHTYNTRETTTFQNQQAIQDTQNQTYTEQMNSTEAYHAWEKRQRLIESAIRCEHIMRPLWEELVEISKNSDFQRAFMASESAQKWQEKVLAAQEKDASQHLSVQQRFATSQCLRDFTIIGAPSPGFHIPIELLVAARAFSSDPDVVGTLMATQIQNWLAWVATLEP